MNMYSIKNKGVAGNIWKFFVLATTNKRNYMTFFSIFLLTIPDATAQTVGLVTSIGQIVGFLFEVPSGYFADIFGHKNTLILGKLFLVLSTLMLVLAHSVVFFILAQIFMSLGFAFISGTQAAFFQETLQYIGKEKEYSSIIGKIKSASYVIPIFFIVLLPYIAQHYGYQQAFLVAFVLDLIGLVTALSLTNIPETKDIDQFIQKDERSMIQQYIHIPWFSYVLIQRIAFALLFAATVGFKNPFQKELGFSLTIMGVFWALSRVGISLTLLLNGYFKKHLSFKKLILLQTSLYAFDLLVVGLSHNKWLIAVAFILGTIAMWGFDSVQKHFYLEYIKDSEYKASFLSLNTFIGKIVGAGFSLLMGYLVLHKGYQFGFLSFGVLLTILLFIGFIIINKNKKTFFKK